MNVIMGVGVFVATLIVAVWFFFLKTVTAENKTRAAFRGSLPFLAALTTLFLLLKINSTIILIIIFAITGICGIFILWPERTPKKLKISGPQTPIDEGDAFFHRFYKLKKNTPEYEAYYTKHPEKQKMDERVRKLPDIASPGTRVFDALTSPFQQAIMAETSRLTQETEDSIPPVSGQAIEVETITFSDRLKNYARYLGADIVGTTKLNPAYIYSHVARGAGQWGDPIHLPHTHAIVIAVEMSHKMISQAPENPALTETSFQYFETAKITRILARYIRSLGYPARAHVDGNYQVMCIPIAADAGLGELGRLGLLVTEKYGPRVRLSVVTTSLPLTQDPPIMFGVQDFCQICKKCAINCPSGSISSTDKQIYTGVEKWQSDQDKCYHFWRLQGTDCGICIKVCPFAYPDTWLHNIMRWVVKRNKISRRLAFWGDQFIYSKKPELSSPVR
ncbi:reductive dehalogenase [bacterium]|nr:reductive dehalogenase [bacterium]